MSQLSGDALMAVYQVFANLNVETPVGHPLDFTITGVSDKKSDLYMCIVIISSPENSFPLSANGDTFIRGTVDKTGKIDNASVHDYRTR